MKITEEQFDKIKHVLPKPRGNVNTEQMDFINALLYICENGCKWRRLPSEHGKWHPIYKRFNYWVEKGYVEKLFCELFDQELFRGSTQPLFMDSTTNKVHPDACGALKKTANSP